MREDSISQPRIGQARQHRRLHSGHDLASLGADHREAEDAVFAAADQDLQEALRFARRFRPQDIARSQSCDAGGDAPALRARSAPRAPAEGP